jgi:hypothetical protein
MEIVILSFDGRVRGYLNDFTDAIDAACKSKFAGPSSAADRNK